MSTVGTIVVALLAVGLLVTAVLLVRSRPAVPWPAIIAATVASGICFTVGGNAARDTSGPDIAIVTGGVVGFLCVVSAVVALLPRPAGSQDRPPSRVPFVLSTTGVVLGALGLLVSLVTG